MSAAFTHPERLLRSFGIERPEEIDLEAIAWELGAKIRTQRLNTCEARIVGRNGQAIITVDDRRHPRRRRFSIAHELGHWQHHRGHCLVCRAEDIGSTRDRGSSDPERVADEYASDLILPRYLLEPLARDVPRVTVRSLGEIADQFDASKTATLLKVASLDHHPIMVVCSGQGGRKWFRRAPSVPSKWFPRDDVSPDSSAFEMIYGKKPESPTPRPIKATAWFDRDASGYMLQEQSFRVSDVDIVTILTFVEKRMMVG